MQAFLKHLTEFGKLFLAIVVWLVLFIAAIESVTWMVTDNYQASDVPDEKFKVLIIDSGGDEHAVNWKTAQQTVTTKISTQKTSGHSEDYLVPLADGSLLYHNEGALWHTESVYRIEKNTLIPISFIFFSFAHAFYAIVMASLLYAICKYGIRRWQLRNSIEETKAYNRKVLNGIRKFTLWVVFVIVIVMILSIVN